MSDPALVEAVAPLDVVKSVLVGIGATAAGSRSVVLEIGDHVLVLGYEETTRSTVVAVGGAEALSMATWLADQLTDGGCRVSAVLPPLGLAGPPRTA